MTPRVRSLATRVVTVAVGVGLVAGGFGLLVIRATVRDALRSHEEDEVRALAAQVAAAVDAEVGYLEDAARQFSSRGSVRALDPGGADLASALQASERVDLLVVTDTTGTPVAAASRDEGGLETLPAPPDSIADLRAGQTVVDLAGSPPEVRVVVAVENPPGTVVGALVAWAPADALIRSASSSGLGRSARAFVTARDGLIVARERGDDPDRTERYPLTEIRAGDRDVEVIDRGGRSVVAAVAEAGTLPLSVVVQQDASEAFARSNRQLGGITAVVALTLMAVLLAALVVVPRLLAPFHHLARTVRALHEGDLSARARVGGSAEVRAVAREVNRMAEALDGRFRELDEAQKELAETEDRFRAAFDEAPVAMAIVTSEGVYEQVNPAMCALLGRTEAEFLGKTWRDVTHPDDIESNALVLEAARRSGNRSFHLEKRYVHAAGYPVWALTSVALIHGGDDVESMIVHIQDITEQRRSHEDREALLHHAVAAEERINRILEGAPDATLVVLEGGQIAYGNRRSAEMFGYDPTELIGEDVEALLPERFRERHANHRRQYRDNPRARPMGAGLALWGRRRDGSEFPVEVSLSPLAIEGETQVVASVRDVTERRRAEETSRALDAMRARQRQAVELNDNIVQGLTVAKWAFESERLAEARRAVERTLEAAQALIQDMLREASAVELMAGDLVRQHPADFTQ